MAQKTRSFEVVKRPHSKFPLNPGAEFAIAAHLNIWEWVAGSEMYEINIASELEKGTIKEIPDISKQQKKKNASFSEIQNDYSEYGYLEDWQVEWLLENMDWANEEIWKLRSENKTLSTTLKVILDNAEENYNTEIEEPIFLVEISPELYRELKNRINYED